VSVGFAPGHWHHRPICVLTRFPLFFIIVCQCPVPKAVAKSKFTQIEFSSGLFVCCRFEKLDITPKSAQKIKPVLERWMKEAEERLVPFFCSLHPCKKIGNRTLLATIATIFL
jgi:hypothetical protein